MLVILTLRTGVCKSTGGLEVKSMIDLMLVKKPMLRYVQHVRAVIKMERGLSDHMLYYEKLGRWV